MTKTGTCPVIAVGELSVELERDFAQRSSILPLFAKAPFFSMKIRILYNFFK
jgi:hypothetical protein